MKVATQCLDFNSHNLKFSMFYSARISENLKERVFYKDMIKFPSKNELTITYTLIIQITIVKIYNQKSRKEVLENSLMKKS